MITMNYDGSPGTTVKFTASADTAYSLTDMLADIETDGGRIAQAVIISIETQSCRISFTVDATQALGHLRADGDTFQITGRAAVQRLTIANAGAGSNFVAQITPLF